MNQATGTTHGSNLQDALQGRWDVIYQEIDGEGIRGEDSPTTIEFRDHEFKIEQNGAVTYEGIFTLRPGTPAEIVLIYRKSKNPLFQGGPRAGILQVEGDTLKFNFSGVGHSAPKSFNTFPGTESVLSVYQREAKAKAKAATGVAAQRFSQLRSVSPW